MQNCIDHVSMELGKHKQSQSEGFHFWQGIPVNLGGAFQISDYQLRLNTTLIMYSATVILFPGLPQGLRLSRDEEAIVVKLLLL